MPSYVKPSDYFHSTIFSEKECFWHLVFNIKNWQYNIITSTVSNVKTSNDLCPVGPELQKKGRENLAARPSGKSQQHDISQ